MLYEAIKHIYPSILDSQFSLRDDGTGPYIKDWSYNQPKPTKAQIDAAKVALTTKVVVPTDVQMAQARKALLQSGHLQHANDYINGLVGAEGEAARIDWEYSLRVRRDYPLVEALRIELALSHEEVDALFVLANTL